MRVDKYLKVARLIKRRTVAKEAADYQKIEVNGKTAKPATQLAVGDMIVLHLGLKIITVKVTALTVVKDGLMYDFISETKKNFQ